MDRRPLSFRHREDRRRKHLRGGAPRYQRILRRVASHNDRCACAQRNGRRHIMGRRRQGCAGEIDSRPLGAQRRIDRATGGLRNFARGSSDAARPVRGERRHILEEFNKLGAGRALAGVPVHAAQVEVHCFLGAVLRHPVKPTKWKVIRIVHMPATSGHAFYLQMSTILHKPLRLKQNIYPLISFLYPNSVC